MNWPAILIGATAGSVLGGLAFGFTGSVEFAAAGLSLSGLVMALVGRHRRDRLLEGATAGALALCFALCGLLVVSIGGGDGLLGDHTLLAVVVAFGYALTLAPLVAIASAMTAGMARRIPVEPRL